MNLRKVENYNIGLDIGTGSVGWAVTDQDGELCHFKGKPTWGSRLFPNAETAAGTRIKRGQRRRYDRRRQRLNYLQEFFLDEMQKVDPDFFIRLNQSRLLPEDRQDGHADYQWPLFNDSDFTESDYYKRFPTIYHLRRWLIDTDEKADIRLIYLAFHNIVKARGNFLHQDNKNLSASKADMLDGIKRFNEAFSDWCELNEFEVVGFKEKEMAAILQDDSLSKREKQEQIVELFGLDKVLSNKIAKPISQAFVGYKADFDSIFFDGGEAPKFSLDNEEKVNEFQAGCPDESLELFEAIKGVYSAFILMGILQNADGGTISSCKIAEYEQYGKDLKTLKSLMRTYASKEDYDTFFRGEMYQGTSLYVPGKASGYTKYDTVRKTKKNKMSSYKILKNEIVQLLGKTPAIKTNEYKEMIQGFEAHKFLWRLKTSDNGSIPYQLHLEEMTAIINNQALFYPWLKQQQPEIESLVTFRIPYYVGPLTQKNAAKAQEKNRFAWSVRKPGMENDKITPWNWDQIIDKHRSAQAFIERMTGTCSYLQGEPVLPRCSLLYERFCMLNELNGARMTVDGDKEYRFDYSDRSDIVCELFERQNSVSYKNICDWMKRHGRTCFEVKGGQGERGFKSKLSSYRFFCDKVFKSDTINESDLPMVEDLILWNTLFEDRVILKEEIKRNYGDRLDAAQINTICRKRFAGWGTLSKKFLVGMKVQTSDGEKSIMDVLEEGQPNNPHPGSALVLMEILHDDKMNFIEKIDEVNLETVRSKGGLKIEDLPGSPALRRSINQTLRIIREIVGITGKSPNNIFIEVTRVEDSRAKGKRTKRRYDNIKEALKAFKEADKSVLNELAELKPDDLDEKLTLYFMQNGRCLYCDRSLDLNRLSEYQVDHIIPQAYIKDDSYENKALVHSECNQRKSDALLLDASVRSKMKARWVALHDAKLMGDKKFNNLMRSTITDKQMKGFIARQLVETSQIVKYVQQFLSEEYPDTRVLPIKASVSHQLRAAQGFVKCREANDYHHAHDALLVCEIGRFVLFRHSSMFDNPIKYSRAIRSYVKAQSKELQRGRMPGSADFIVSSFLRPGIDMDTGEIIKDTWVPQYECNRIRRFLNYRDCFISRMPEITAGPFWDETIYSPRDTKKKLTLPLKKGLDPHKYGSFSREQFAYFFVYEAENKKGNTVRDLAPVPISLVNSLEDSPEKLDEYAASIAAEAKLSFHKVIRPKIAKYQLLEVDGSRVLLTGAKEVRNGRQLSFNQEELAALEAITEKQIINQDTLLQLYRQVEKAIHSSLLGRSLKLAEKEPLFEKADYEERAKAILSLVGISNAAVNMIDLKLIGGSKYSGCLNPTFSKLLSSGDVEVVVVDQSVTGMFERRQKIGL